MYKLGYNTCKPQPITTPTTEKGRFRLVMRLRRVSCEEIGVTTFKWKVNVFCLALLNSKYFVHVCIRTDTYRCLCTVTSSKMYCRITITHTVRTQKTLGKKVQLWKISKTIGHHDSRYDHCIVVCDLKTNHFKPIQTNPNKVKVGKSTQTKPN